MMISTASIRNELRHDHATNPIKNFIKQKMAMIPTNS